MNPRDMYYSLIITCSPCSPPTMANTFRKFSEAFSKVSKNFKASPVDATTVLADFVSTAKKKYLEAKELPSRGGEWTVVMGNESCGNIPYHVAKQLRLLTILLADLDSIASSIAYAWVESEVHRRPTVPLIPMQREDLHLRAENIYALNLAGIYKPREQLLFLTDIPHLNDPDTSFPSQRFVLVDHNKIKDRYLHNNVDGRVVAIVDHREDEGLYKNTADPRIVLPCGSCCSHITTSVLPSRDNPLGISVPRELATLLLCGVLIDTDGLRPGGKALQVDRDAAVILIPLSTYSEMIPMTLSHDGGMRPDEHAVYDDKSIKDLTSTLSRKKLDLSHLGTRDLLRRDCKVYDYCVEWLPGSPLVRVGLSSVPMPLCEWGKEGTIKDEIFSWMKARGIHIHGVITSFKEKPSKKGSNKGKEKDKGTGKSRREQVWMVVDPGVLGTAEQAAYSSRGRQIDLVKLTARFFESLEKDGALQLGEHQLRLNKNGGLSAGVDVRVYHQRDSNPTRKYTAPLVKKILTEQVAVSLPNKS